MAPILINRRQALGAGCAAASMPFCARAATAPTNIKVVMTAGVSGLILHELARQEGYFEEANVDPTVLAVADGSKCVAALLSGSSEICMWSGFNQLTPAMEKGARIKILAGALLLPSLAMASARPDIQKVEDLEGKVIGIAALGSVLHQMSVYLLQKKGVNTEKITFRNVGTNDDIFKAVAAKTVDAGLADVGDFARGASLGVRALSNGKLWLEIPDYTNQGSYASDASIQANRDVLVRLLSAYAKVYRFVEQAESREPYLKARATVNGKPDPVQGLIQWNWIHTYKPYAKDLVLSAARINLVQQLNVDFKVQKKILPVSSISDDSLAKDAVKRLA